MVRPPKGYQILAVGAPVHPGDLYFDVSEWVPATCKEVTREGYGLFARKVLTEVPVMPKIHLAVLHKKLDPETYSMVLRIIDEETWQVRRSRPTITFDPDGELTEHCAFATYIWRNVVFIVSPHNRHQCMPIGAAFYLPRNIDDIEIKKIIQQLDKVVDMIIDTVPANLWHGVKRWRTLQGDFYND